eukprot:TRINITY_DN26694_c0_g1_i1.p1 TRINITY_DN26694_c0_g1~~TRINITY_DN26694_c0_g1_i1.p1  ORF type:complete len:909 (-),score=120.40 TRINITY_DN26694_c0_g1_i1:257-2983(-)
MNYTFSNASGGAADIWNAAGQEQSPASVSLVLLCTFLIISMQLGFAMLEVGSVREEHRMTVLAKNLLDSVVSFLTFALVCQYQSPSLILNKQGVAEKHMQLFHWSFLATSVTICSGSMAERTHMFAYLCYAVAMSGLIYPVVADSTWGRGSGSLHYQFHDLFGTGYQYRDYAGSGVVHLTGGVAALVGNVLLGRRIMRPRNKDWGYTMSDSGEIVKNASPGAQDNDDTHLVARCLEEGTLLEEDERLKDALFVGWQRRFDSIEDDEREFRANSYLQVLGMFNLWVGWYGFNTATAFARDAETSSVLAGIVAWNTTLGASTGALGAFLHCYFLHKSLDTGFLCNGVLGGLVAITASCDIATPLATGLIGFVAGFIVYPLASHLLRRFRLDDPVDAISVHAGCGLFGVLACTFCKPACSEIVQSCSQVYSMGFQFLAQAWGAFTIIWFTLCIVTLLWMVFALSEGIRLLEVNQLVLAYKQAGLVLQEDHSPSSSDARKAEIWKPIASLSRTVRSLLRESGWQGESFCVKGADAIESFRDELLEAIQDRLKSAMEMKALPVRLVLCVTNVIFRVGPLRELAVLRLRISPFAELSGLGVTASDSGQVWHALKDVMHVVSNLQSAQSNNLPSQVEQLSRHVQSQGLLLQRLASRRRLSAGLAAIRLSSVPEDDHQSSPKSSSKENKGSSPAEDDSLSGTWSGHLTSHPMRNRESTPPPMTTPEPRTRGRELQTEHQPAAMTRSTTPEERPNHHRRPSVRSVHSETESTVSDRSMGSLSQRSAGQDTPPPAVYGRGLSPRGVDGRSLAQMAPQLSQAPQAEAIAAQLMSLLSAQQNLMSALHAGSDNQNAFPNNQFASHFGRELLENMQRRGLELGNSQPSSARSSHSSRSRRSQRSTPSAYFQPYSAQHGAQH